MDPAHRAVLRKFRVDLSEQLLVSDSIVPFLFQEGVLSPAQVEQVEAQVTNRSKTLKLLDLLPNRGPRAFPTFLQALQDFSWIRDQLLQELQTAPGPGPGPGLTGDLLLPDSLLHKVPSDRDLSRLASRLGAQWELVLLDLGLSPEALYRCRADHSLSSQSAVLAGLVQWRRSEGRKATVERLLQSLQAAGLDPSVLEDVLL
ncbi:death domain-containing protein CRADD [Austrofundulus limnaeus]|uniref:Death domain-containing protein CRADD n=1 Tax=Austrofundulus limnaeus TaxID=52670 RepID=A0A2I4D7D7_AUSLI|nr:PREDICTED: death domain-containing protein CRADD-like [Austrofundulus limnaeus]